MKNTGKPYEELTEQVFNRLLAQDKVCAQVKRDVILDGRSTRHQIDVTFEFVVGPIRYRNIVQCKDWNSPVKQEQVLAFLGVLADIPGQPRGIMVSRSGFQEGARRVADHHGIKLYELREPRDEDWEGLIRKIPIHLHICHSHFEDTRLFFDEDAIRKHLHNRDLPLLEIKFSFNPNITPLKNEATDEQINLDDLLNGLIPKTGVPPYRIRHDFTDRVILEVPTSPIPRLPVVAIETTVSIHNSIHKSQINFDHLIAYCFKDILENKVHFIGAAGEPPSL
ncbi:MAG: restriction endonuclease [Myxococcales bacterium]|jgi:hypothetical protein|nr:restriction endonuclease [Myxococcales bacterium]